MGGVLLTAHGRCGHPLYMEHYLEMLLRSIFVTQNHQINAQQFSPQFFMCAKVGVEEDSDSEGGAVNGII